MSHLRVGDIKGIGSVRSSLNVSLGALPLLRLLALFGLKQPSRLSGARAGCSRSTYAGNFARSFGALESGKDRNETSGSIKLNEMRSRLRPQAQYPRPRAADVPSPPRRALGKPPAHPPRLEEIVRQEYRRYS